MKVWKAGDPLKRRRRSSLSGLTLGDSDRQKWPLLLFSFQGVSPQGREQRSKGERGKNK